MEYCSRVGWSFKKSFIPLQNLHTILDCLAVSNNTFILQIPLSAHCGCYKFYSKLCRLSHAFPVSVYYLYQIKHHQTTNKQKLQIYQIPFPTPNVTWVKQGLVNVRAAINNSFMLRKCHMTMYNGKGDIHRENITKIR